MDKCCEQQTAEGLCKSSPNCAAKLKQQMSERSSSITSVFGVPVTESNLPMSGAQHCDQSSPVTHAGGLIPYEKLQEMCNSLQVDNAYLRERLRESTADVVERMAVKCSRFFIDGGRIHPDIAFDQMNETARAACHSTAQALCLELAEEAVRIMKG